MRRHPALILAACFMVFACGNSSTTHAVDAGPGDVVGAEALAPETTPPGPGCQCGNGFCETACGEHLPGDGFCRDDCCICGDGHCQQDQCGEAWAEGAHTCATDCAECGNGSCDPGEGPVKCPLDCCGSCGDGQCKGGECGEDPESCKADCGKHACGNGACEPGENPMDCVEDCEPYACGNHTCEPGEDPGSCPQDCDTSCGDCKCDGGETYDNCPIDCGFCGDGYCIQHCPYLPESPAECPLDCCLPQCAGKECGPDECGGQCGQCPDGSTCGVDGTCEPLCVPFCAPGQECGPDHCGGDCGECGEGKECLGDGTCFCLPQCEGKQCGTDGCDGACGSCPDTHSCNDDGLCKCDGDCAGKECGDDGCGGACGICANPGDACVAGVCTCPPDCVGKECGPDGCGESCGVCSNTQDECLDGLCTCTPACELKNCGPDGCGGNCGKCAGPGECVDGECQCLPDCDWKECGDDGCGGSCGDCVGDGAACADGLCVCFPNCAGKQCGPDGCGGFCGWCEDDEKCLAGDCYCDPQCEDKFCGPDACGFDCGVGDNCPNDSEECLNGVCVGDGVCHDGDQDQWDGCYNGAIQEFQANTFGLFSQRYPSAAGFSDGSYVLVWQSWEQDGEENGIFGQRVTADGSNEGSEFMVHESGYGNQRHPRVAALADDRFVVVWQDSATGTGFDGTALRVYDVNGAEQSGVMSLDETQVPNAARRPAVAAAGTGYLAVWEVCPPDQLPELGADGDNCGVFGRHFDAAGAAGDEFQVNTTFTASQSKPAVAGLPDGGFVVVWQSYGQDGDQEGIVGRLYESTGQPVGPEFLVNAYAAGTQELPDVAAIKSGAASGFVVVWSGEGEDDPNGVYRRSFDVPGPTAGTEHRVNYKTEFVHTGARVAALLDDFFVVTWEGELQDGSGSGIFGNVFSWDEALVTGEFGAGKYTEGDQSSPAVAALPSLGVTPGTGFIVVWASAAQDGSGDGVFALRMRATDTGLVYH